MKKIFTIVYSDAEELTNMIEKIFNDFDRNITFDRVTRINSGTLGREAILIEATIPPKKKRVFECIHKFGIIDTIHDKINLWLQSLDKENVSIEKFIIHEDNGSDKLVHAEIIYSYDVFEETKEE